MADVHRFPCGVRVVILVFSTDVDHVYIATLQGIALALKEECIHLALCLQIMSTIQQNLELDTFSIGRHLLQHDFLTRLIFGCSDSCLHPKPRSEVTKSSRIVLIVQNENRKDWLQNL